VTTSASERDDLSQIALLVAEEAATLVAAGHRSSPRADRKGKNDLVTQFDLASERLLTARLSSLSPGIPVVGEESAAAQTRGRAGLVWYVDPIDGTTNFVHGHPFWCVAVGLAEDDQAVAGAVVAPILGTRWRGFVVPAPVPPPSSGPVGGTRTRRTSFRNGEPCSVSATADLGEALVATGFPAARGRAPDNNFDAFIAVKKVVQGVRRCGAAAIDLCMVADGTYDGYWERSLHAWDTVAASAVVVGAGGVVTTLAGGAPDHHAGHVAASNGLVHQALLAAIGA
jgi:myo-inositol-1(or 4)-monophosphatase